MSTCVRAQICLAMAACCTLLVSANKGSYKYGYGVSDSITGDVKEQQESKIGDQVTGYYRMLESDGRMRTVTYDANPLTGFRAKVSHAPGDGRTLLAGAGLGGSAKSWSTMHRLDHNTAADAAAWTSDSYPAAAPAPIDLQKPAFQLMRGDEGWAWSDAPLLRTHYDSGYEIPYAPHAPYTETKTWSAVDHGASIAGAAAYLPAAAYSPAATLPAARILAPALPYATSPLLAPSSYLPSYAAAAPELDMKTMAAIPEALPAAYIAKSGPKIISYTTPEALPLPYISTPGPKFFSSSIAPEALIAATSEPCLKK